MRNPESALISPLRTTLFREDAAASFGPRHFARARPGGPHVATMHPESALEVTSATAGSGRRRAVEILPTSQGKRGRCCGATSFAQCEQSSDTLIVRRTTTRTTSSFPGPFTRLNSVCSRGFRMSVTTHRFSGELPHAVDLHVESLGFELADGHRCRLRDRWYRGRGEHRDDTGRSSGGGEERPYAPLARCGLSSWLTPLVWAWHQVHAVERTPTECGRRGVRRLEVVWRTDGDPGHNELMIAMPAVAWRGGPVRRGATIAVCAGLFFGALAWLDSGLLIAGAVVFVVLGAGSGIWMTSRMSRYWPGSRELSGDQRVAVVAAPCDAATASAMRLSRPQSSATPADCMRAAEKGRPWRWVLVCILVVAVATAIWDAVYGSIGNAVVSVIYLVLLGFELFWWPKRQAALLATPTDRLAVNAFEVLVEVTTSYRSRLSLSQQNRHLEVPP